MSERSDYPAGVPSWVEKLSADPDRAREFYAAVFGWEFAGPGPMPEGGAYHVARLGGRDVAGVGALPEGAAPDWYTHISVDRVEDAIDAATAAGGTPVTGPVDANPAGRLAVIDDPEGARFCVWEAQERRGAQRLNEPSAWSMSSVNPRDPERAIAFYGAVFGWQAEPFEFGGTTMHMFRLPGYEGGTPFQPVPRDVVAMLIPLGDQDAAPHWSVDFWIADAEAAAATAREAGGDVVMAPTEAPPFLTAALADPDGARFSVSQLRVG